MPLYSILTGAFDSQRHAARMGHWQMVLGVAFVTAWLTGCSASRSEASGLAGSGADTAVLEHQRLDGWSYQREDLGDGRRRIRLWRGSRELIGPDGAELETPFGLFTWVADASAAVVGWVPPGMQSPVAPEASDTDGLVLTVQAVDMAERTRPNPERSQVYAEEAGWIYAVESVAEGILVGRLWRGLDEIGGRRGERVATPWGVMVYHHGEAAGWFPPGAAPE